MKIVLAYSGGLDTSVAVKWLAETYQAQIVTVTVDLGGTKNLEAIKQKALKLGAVTAHVIPVKEEFSEHYILPALKANALYEGRYPLATALSRPLIAKVLAEIAEREGAEAVAHGCTGKGNDQVRFEVSLSALNPKLKVIAPAREWKFTRETAIRYANDHNIPLPVNLESPFSIDENIWGRSIECGVLEDISKEPPEEVYQWTQSGVKSPNESRYVKITFERGKPVGLDGKPKDFASLIEALNTVAGQCGVGRIDHVENRLIGIKSREIYESPAGVVLVEAHKDLEGLTQTREVIHFKQLLDQKFAELIYNGLWYSPLREALDAFNQKVQETVSGTITLRLYKGSYAVVSRESPSSLYSYQLATYAEEDLFNQQAAKGFIELFGLSTKTFHQVQRHLNQPQKLQVS